MAASNIDKNKYQNGASNFTEQTTKQPELYSFPIYANSQLVGFIELDEHAELPAILTIRDHYYIIGKKAI